jgi:hypothetical protein
MLGRVPLLDTNQHCAKRGSDRPGESDLVPDLLAALVSTFVHHIFEKVQSQ